MKCFGLSRAYAPPLVVELPEIVFWGATGQAKVLHEALFDTSIRLVALIDNRDLRSPIDGVPVLHGDAGLENLICRYGKPEDLLFAVALGGSRGRDRVLLMENMRVRGLVPFTIVHRTAFVATDASVGQACQILAMSAVCSRARLESAVIVNTAASVDHDCWVSQGAHIGPGARLAGEVFIGQRVFIGTGAIILPRIRIGDDSIIGAGSVVTANVSSGTTVVGNPARPIRKDSCK
jgi:sugar O-acyltransferase (sialic acid O-acetyltransferase NeuD family)